MPEDKTGPVKPPILDLAAKKAPQDGAGDKTNPTRKTTKPASNKLFGLLDFSDISWLTIAISVAGGALLGMILAFGLAAGGFWPEQIQSTQPTEEVAQLARRAERIELDNAHVAGKLTAMQSTIDDLQAKLTNQYQVTDAQQIDFQALQTQLNQIQSPAPQDLSPLENQIAQLNAQIKAIAAGTAPEQADALTNKMDQISRVLETLTARLSTLETDAQANTETTHELTQQIVVLSETTAAPQPNSALQIPLALSGIETAINTGRPFANELSLLIVTLPSLSPSPSLTQAAKVGLPAPDQVSINLGRAIPEMLAAKPVDPTANWTDNLLDRAKALVALRPTGAVTGQTPEAIIARLELALSKRQFIEAEKLLKSLPDPVQAVASDIAGQLAALADAQTFVEKSRATALALPEANEAVQ